jgi:hypothetical protein
MSLNFTLKPAAFLCLLLFGFVTANSQANVNPTSGCDNTVRDICATTPVTNAFTSGAEGFTGVGGAPLLAYNPAEQNLSTGGANPASTEGNVAYVLTTPSFDAAGGVSLGFVIGNVRTQSITVEALSAANPAIVLASCESAIPSGIGPVCFNFTDPDLTGQTVVFRISLLTRKGNGIQGVLTFDDFRVAFVELAPTPVNFTSFEGKRITNGIQLTWNVADEINVNKYEVERSTSGNSGFTVIGSVSAKGLPSYSFTDESPLSGQVYYRVKNVDNDGLFSYSNQISFKNGASTLVFRVFPTLVTNKTEVQHGTTTGTEAITLSTADGRLVRSLRPAAGSLKTTVEMGDLRAGLYILRYRTSNGTVETVKLVKQ